MKTPPLISIVITSYNGEDFLDRCLTSIYKSSFKNFEVVLIDNASFKKCSDVIAEKFISQTNFKLIRLDKNLGSSVGRNYGVKHAEAQYLFFLDVDAVIKKDCLEVFVDFIEKYPKVGAVHAKLLNSEERHLYDCGGYYLDNFGFLVDRAQGREDIGDLDFISPVLSGKTAAVFLSKEVYDKVGGFDEDYYFFLEDTDFDWRIWLMGYQVLFLPQAVVYHAFNTAEKTRNKKHYYTDFTIKYYGSRNYLLTLIKNLGVKKLFQILPLHIFCWLTVAFSFFLKRNFKRGFYILRGLSWNFFNLAFVLKKRKAIQCKRVVSDFDIDFLFGKKEGLGHYLSKIISYIND